MNNSSVEMPIIDGFMYNPLLRYVGMRWLPLAYEGLHDFRVGAWQPRLYTAPSGNGGMVVPAGTTVTQQVRMSVSGCFLIGYTLGTLTSTPANVGVVVLDADSDLSGNGGYTFANGIDRYVVGSAFAPASVVGHSGPSGQHFCLLTKPYFVTSDLLTVKLSNLTTATNIQLQLCLYVMEPFSVAK